MSTPDTLTRELDALDDALAGRAVDPDLAELAELAVALRDERPAPDPAFTRTLDTRVEGGFPRAKRTARARRAFTWPRVTLPALGVAASVLLVIVIATSIPTGGGGGGGEDAGDSGGSVATTEEAPADTASEPSSAAKPRAAAEEPATSNSIAPSATQVPPDSSGAPQSAIAPLPTTPAVPGDLRADRTARRSVERSAELVLATPPREIDRAAAAILRVTNELGGYVVSSTVSSNSSGQFELRVPERKLQAALARLSRIAKVRQRTQGAQDITGAVVSVRERLKDARTERRSLLRQLAAAVTPNQTASIRARLRLVSGQIAAAKRDLSRVQTRATRSTIAVSLLAERRGAGGNDDDGASGWTPADAFDDAVRILEVTAGVLLVALALLLPLGLVALLVWLAARQAAQRRRERALDAV